MIHTLKSVLLLAGLGTLACAAAPASQPETQVAPAPNVYSLSSGSRSYLGVDIQDITAERVGPLKLKEERGVEVTMVDQDAPAGKAGLKEHDVILDFNGTAVEGEEQLRRMIRETPPGRTVTLGISRDGNPMKISVQLADRGKLAPDTSAKVFALPRMPNIPKVEVPNYVFQLQTYSPSLGIQTENLSRQLGEYFGVKDGEGVLVRSVEKGSAAEKAGIKAGDVIVRADNEKLSDRADLSHVLRNHREGGKISLGVVRDKHEQTIVVDLPRRGASDSSFWPDSDQLHFNWNNFEEELDRYLDEIEPAVERTRVIASENVEAALEKARRQVRVTARPEVENAMRQAEQQLRRAQRLLDKQRRELRHKLDDMI